MSVNKTKGVGKVLFEDDISALCARCMDYEVKHETFFTPTDLYGAFQLHGRTIPLEIHSVERVDIMFKCVRQRLAVTEFKGQHRP